MLIGVLENQLADRLHEKYTFVVLSTWSQFYLIRGLIYIVTYCMWQSHFLASFYMIPCPHQIY